MNLLSLLPIVSGEGLARAETHTDNKQISRSGGGESVRNEESVCKKPRDACSAGMLSGTWHEWAQPQLASLISY